MKQQQAQQEEKPQSTTMEGKQYSMKEQQPAH
jgi:hypothetical protein